MPPYNSSINKKEQTVKTIWLPMGKITLLCSSKSV